MLCLAESQEGREGRQALRPQPLRQLREDRGRRAAEEAVHVARDAEQGRLPGGAPKDGVELDEMKMFQ